MVIIKIGYHDVGYYIINDDAVCFDSSTVELLSVRARVGVSEGESGWNGIGCFNTCWKCTSMLGEVFSRLVNSIGEEK